LGIEILDDFLGRDSLVFDLELGGILGDIDWQKIVDALYLDTVPGIIDEGEIPGLDRLDKPSKSGPHFEPFEIIYEVNIGRSEPVAFESRGNIRGIVPGVFERLPGVTAVSYDECEAATGTGFELCRFKASGWLRRALRVERDNVTQFRSHQTTANE
jgi:hypothetical protein